MRAHSTRLRAWLLYGTSRAKSCLQRLEKELGLERMTVEEFRAEGEADTLTDANLRELWLHYRDLLVEE